ncbi:hypothetical protein AB3R30_26260 [Leptolyngbyaceae cyanobacterium UHCC 1019]
MATGINFNRPEFNRPKWKRIIVAIASVAATLNVWAYIAQSQPASVNLSPQFSPVELRGTTGGATPVNEITGRAATPTGLCTGFANSAPSHTIVLKGFTESLRILVESSEDTALAIRGPGGVWCNDDFVGKNPGVTGQWLAGKYEIWVSSYAKNRTAPYVLRIRR